MERDAMCEEAYRIIQFVTDSAEGDIDLICHGDERIALMALARGMELSAAPELLEALRYARRFLRPEDHDTAFVDAAIAKAMGE